MHSYNNIYIGKIIQQKLDASRMSYAEFARRIHVARTSLYRIFESKSIDIERLILISDVLGYDFIHEVYLSSDSQPFVEPATIVLPIVDGHVVTANLPPILLQLLREAVNDA
ncbi:MAG: helix-turn-helix transcriptional regulator [Bacteroidaceae bacterium]|nr:helix-turn-helix transcriptional regulator [Bacteroidaceae bacterium]